MRTLLMMVAVLAVLAGCSDDPTAGARARVASDLNVVPPAQSRPIVEPEGNVVECKIYPGGGAGEVCLDR